MRKLLAALAAGSAVMAPITSAYAGDANNVASSDTVAAASGRHSATQAKNRTASKNNKTSGANNTTASANGAYDLGDIYIYVLGGSPGSFNSFSGAYISSKQIQTFSALTLDRALNLAPGVVSAPAGGSRNQQEIYIHGFNRYEIPLYVNGIRSYYPASNQLDYGPQLTDDIARIQIAKGYVSVIDGPDGLGGAVNMITKRPTRPYEVETHDVLQFGNNGAFDGLLTYLRLGTRQQNYFLQASGTFAKYNGWELPFGFTPSPKSDENGGHRNWSQSNILTGAVTGGYTPNATDEYVLRYSVDNMNKYSSPTSTGLKSKNFSWPFWQTENLTFSSTTLIDPSDYVKTKAFLQSFDQDMQSYKDAARKIQQGNSSFDLFSRDWVAGGSVEAGHDFGGVDTLKGLLFYQQEHHTEWRNLFVNSSGTGKGCTTNVVCLTEPHQYAQQSMFTAALENTYHLTPTIDLVQGVSGNWQNQQQAQDYILIGSGKKAAYTFVNYPLQNHSHVDWQGAAIWNYEQDAKVYANVSSRSRFPTLWDLYGTKFGNSLPNPFLQPEYATNFQIGWSKLWGPKTQVSVDVYYSIVKNMIQQVDVFDQTTNQVVSMNQNVGNGDRYGLDLGVDYQWTSELDTGGNLTLIQDELTSPSLPGVKPTGVPSYKGMVYLHYTPTDKITVTPNVEFAGDRWDQVQGTYVATGAYVLANIGATYNIEPNVTLLASVTNIFDETYALKSGYPAPGRTFLAGVHATF